MVSLCDRGDQGQSEPGAFGTGIHCRSPAEALGHRVAILRGNAGAAVCDEQLHGVTHDASPDMDAAVMRAVSGCVGGELQHRLRHALTIDDHDAAIPVREFPVLISQGAGLDQQFVEQAPSSTGSG